MVGSAFVRSVKAAAKLLKVASVCLTPMSGSSAEASADRRPPGVSSLKMYEGVVVVGNVDQIRLQKSHCSLA